MTGALRPSAIAVEMREIAERARRLAHDLVPGENRSRLLCYADELEERARDQHLGPVMLDIFSLVRHVEPLCDCVQ
jgi:hypothetical protein